MRPLYPFTPHCDVVQEKMIIKKIVLTLLISAFAMEVLASEVIPPRIVVKMLVTAVQEKRKEVIGWYFSFDKEKHGKLTSLTKEKQILILKDIPLDKLKFDKDEYTVDKGRRFVVCLVAPKKLEFEMEYIKLKGEKGPPWKYNIIAIRKSAQQTSPHRRQTPGF